MIPVLLSMLGLLLAGNRIQDVHGDTTPSLVFSPVESRLSPSRARSFEMHARRMDSFSVEILGAIPESLAREPLRSDLFRPLGRVHSTRRTWEKGPWVRRLDLDSVQRRHGGVVLRLRARLAGVRDGASGKDLATTDIHVGSLDVVSTTMEEAWEELAVSDPSTGMPVAGARIYTCQGERSAKCDSTRTDAKGFGRIPSTSLTAWTVVRRGEDIAIHRRGFTQIDGGFGQPALVEIDDWDRLRHPWLPRQPQRLAPSSSTTGYRIHPYLVRGVHRPGDTVVSGCLVRTGGGRIPSNLPLVVEIDGPGTKFRDTLAALSGREGHFQMRWALPADAPTGPWSLQAHFDGSRSEKLEFQVEVDPPRKLEVELRDFAGKDSSKILVRLSARWQSGRAAAGMAARIRIICDESFGRDPGSYSLPSQLVGRVERKDYHDTLIEGVLGRDGSLAVQLSLGWGPIGWKHASYRVQGDVFLPQGRSVQAREIYGSIQQGMVLGLPRPSLAKAPVLEEPKASPARSKDPPPQPDPEPDLEDPVMAGDTIGFCWEARAGSLVLVQVVQGDRILSREWMRSKPRVTCWKRPARKEWWPSVAVVVHALHGDADSMRPVSQEGYRFRIQPPDRQIEIGLEIPADFKAMVKNQLRIRNVTGQAGTVVVSAVDQGILDLDDHRIADPRSTLTDDPPIGTLWWTEIDTLATRKGWTRFVNSSYSSSARGKRRWLARKQGNPGADQSKPEVWVSPVLALPDTGLVVDVPVGVHSGALRVSAVAMAGHSATRVDTLVTIRLPLEAVWLTPAFVRVGDTLDAGLGLAGRPGAKVSLQWTQSGPLQPLGRPESNIQLDSNGNGIAHARWMAPKGSGTTNLQAWLESEGRRYGQTTEIDVLPSLVDSKLSRSGKPNVTLDWAWKTPTGVPLEPWSVGERTAFELVIDLDNPSKEPVDSVLVEFFLPAGWVVQNNRLAARRQGKHPDEDSADVSDIRWQRKLRLLGGEHRKFVVGLAATSTGTFGHAALLLRTGTGAAKQQVISAGGQSSGAVKKWAQVVWLRHWDGFYGKLGIHGSVSHF